MSEAIYEKVNLMLRLYEMRREPRLRQARAWLVNEYHAATAEEMMAQCPPGSEENASLRMVITYWDICAALSNRGLLDDELFFEQAGEAWVVWEKVKPVMPAWRALFKNPHTLEQLERFVARLEAWRESRAPGSNEAMRQLWNEMTRARAAKSASP